MGEIALELCRRQDAAVADGLKHTTIRVLTGPHRAVLSATLGDPYSANQPSATGASALNALSSDLRQRLQSPYWESATIKGIPIQTDTCTDACTHARTHSRTHMSKACRLSGFEYIPPSLIDFQAALRRAGVSKENFGVQFVVEWSRDGHQESVPMAAMMACLTTCNASLQFLSTMKRKMKGRR